MKLAYFLTGINIKRNEELLEELESCERLDARFALSDVCVAL
jgi:hypothetical protein